MFNCSLRSLPRLLLLLKRILIRIGPTIKESPSLFTHIRGLKHKTGSTVHGGPRINGAGHLNRTGVVISRLLPLFESANFIFEGVSNRNTRQGLRVVGHEVFFEDFSVFIEERVLIEGEVMEVFEVGFEVFDFEEVFC